MTQDPWSPPPSGGGDRPVPGSTATGHGEPGDAAGVEPDVRTSRWGLPDALLTLGLTMAIAVGSILLLRVLGIRPSGPALVLIGTLVPWVALLGVPLWASWRKGRGPVRDYGLTLDRATIGAGVVAGGLALLLAGAAGALQMTLSGREITSAAGEIGKRLAEQPAALILLVLVAAIGAPIVEEIAFRGLLFGALVKRGVPGWATVAITALVFSLYHMEPQRIPLLLVTGVVLGEVRRRTGRTSAAIVAHMVNNAVAALGLLAFL